MFTGKHLYKRMFAGKHSRGIYDEMFTVKQSIFIFMRNVCW